MNRSLFIIPLSKTSKSQKNGHMLHCLGTTALYLYTTLISFGYYSEGQLQKDVWATLTTWKIVHLPVVERFEYVGIANWCLIILPNACLALWCATRLLKQTYRLPQRIGVYLVGAIAVCIIPIFDTRQEIDLLNSLLGNFGFIVNFIYLPLLLILIWMVKKVKKKT